MYIPLIASFILILILIILGLQNTSTLNIEFITWKLQISQTMLIFYAALIGAAILAILVLPKFVNQYLKLRRLQKDFQKIQKKNALEQPLESKQ